MYMTKTVPGSVARGTLVREPATHDIGRTAGTVAGMSMSALPRLLVVAVVVVTLGGCSMFDLPTPERVARSGSQTVEMASPATCTSVSECDVVSLDIYGGVVDLGAASDATLAMTVDGPTPDRFALVNTDGTWTIVVSDGTRERHLITLATETGRTFQVLVTG